jgi:hypothetical protein
MAGPGGAYPLAQAYEAHPNLNGTSSHFCRSKRCNLITKLPVRP